MIYGFEIKLDLKLDFEIKLVGERNYVFFPQSRGCTLEELFSSIISKIDKTYFNVSSW